VTLAFAPYGKDLPSAVSSARAGDHEVLLEVPLEPFDYPDSDPGPDTLLTGEAPRENLNRLFTVLGNQFWSTSLREPIAALPLQIFTFAISPYDEQHSLAWAGALVLIGIVLVISLAARFATRSRFGRGGD